jgi:hypothetical protein
LAFPLSAYETQRRWQQPQQPRKSSWRKA